jgi:hypothetical protein
MNWLGIEYVGWAEHSEAQQDHIVGFHASAQPTLLCQSRYEAFGSGCYAS